MPRTQRLHARLDSKSQIAQGLKQLFILMLTIIIGVLISVSVNAQTAEKKTSDKKKSITNYPFKKKNRTRVNFFASAPAPIIEDGSFKHTSPFQLQLIHEMVAANISTNEVSLPSLVFEVTTEKIATQDILPLLIAMEFARQGKAIRISNASQTDSFDLSIAQLNEIRLLMFRMGVPENKVSIGYENALLQTVLVGNDKKLSRVEFDVI